MAHIGRAGAVDDARDEIRLIRLRVGAFQVEDDQVGALPHLNRSDLRFEAERPRAAQCGQLEGLRRGQRVGTEARLLDQGGEPHLGEGVEAVVARRAVGADADAAPRCQHLRNRRDPAAELQVRARAVDDVRPLPREHGDIVLVHPDAVRQRGARARNADGIEIGDLIVAGLAPHRIELERRFRRVGVHHGAGLLGQIAHRPQQRARTAGRKAWRKAIAEPATGGAMPLRAQVGALRKRCVRRFPERRRRRGRVHQALPRGRPNPDRLECFERGRGMPHGLHVENRRGAAEQELRRAEHGGGVDGRFGVCGFEWPNALGEPRLER